MNVGDTTFKYQDQTAAWDGGMDAGRSPSDIDPNQVALLLNASVRGGRVKPRPGWLRRVLTFPSDAIEAAFSTWVQDGQFYDGTGSPCLTGAHGGRQFRIEIGTWEVSEITPAGSFSVETVADFTIPAYVPPAPLPTVNVSVSQTARLSMDYPAININGMAFTLTAIVDPNTITIKNQVNPAAVVHAGAVVAFMALDSNSPTIPINWSRQAEKWQILQDNQSAAIIYDASSAYRSDASKWQVPCGNVMCYDQGRLIVSLPDSRSFRAGDLVFGGTHDPGEYGRDSVLYFTENNYLNEGGDFTARVFGAPSNSGDILAMEASAQTDTSLGQGAMLVGTPNVIFSLNLPFDRTTWKNLSYAIQTANPIKGPVGHRAVALVNSDLWYRSLDGIRSWVLAQRQFNGSYGNTPMSTEVDVFLDGDSKIWLKYCNMVEFDSRLITTCSPALSAVGIYHRGVVVLDFDPVYGRKKVLPAWEGLWTGLRILKLVTGKVDNIDRCFAWVVGDNSDVQIWELTTDQQYDQNYAYVGQEWTSVQTPITSEIQTRSYNCGDSQKFKKLETARALISDLTGSVIYSVWFKSNEHPCWTPWVSSINLCALIQDCGPFGASGGSTTANFTLPALNASVTISATGITGIATGSWISVGDYSLLVTSVGAGTITVQNLIPYVGSGIAVISSGSAITVSTCATPVEYKPQARWPIALPTPPDTAPTNGRPYRSGYEFELRWQFTGYYELKLMRLYASEADEMLGLDQIGENTQSQR